MALAASHVALAAAHMAVACSATKPPSCCPLRLLCRCTRAPSSLSHAVAVLLNQAAIVLPCPPVQVYKGPIIVAGGHTAASGGEAVASGERCSRRLPRVQLGARLLLASCCWGWAGQRWGRSTAPPLLPMPCMLPHRHAGQLRRRHLLSVLGCLHACCACPCGCGQPGVLPPPPESPTWACSTCWLGSITTPPLSLFPAPTGAADLVCYGRHYIANPDLPRRFRLGAPLNK